MDQLTERQRDIYEFIRDKITNRGYGPTVREIGDQFKIASPNGVMCHLKALEKKGLINREPNMSRAIMLATESFDSQRPGLPLAGRIAAGMRSDWATAAQQTLEIYAEVARHPPAKDA
jgi:repressor LexA